MVTGQGKGITLFRMAADIPLQQGELSRDSSVEHKSDGCLVTNSYRSHKLRLPPV